MECIDFETLFDNNVSVYENVDVLNSYLHLCVEMIVPKKIVKCFPNNKPWVTKELKELLGRKMYIHVNNNWDMLKDIQKQVDDAIHACKINYKRKVEYMFTHNYP